MLIRAHEIAILLAFHNDGSRVKFAAAGAFGVGILLFFRGFRILQLKRLILNTPSSKIRSASMGLVEVNGMAVGPNPIPAGITGDPCYYYRATAWQLQESGNRREWKRAADESAFVPFFVEDTTGRLLVNPQGAALDVHRNFRDEFGTSFFGSRDMMPESVRKFLLRNGISGGEVRLEEYCIKPGYPLFIFGTLGTNTTTGSPGPQTHLATSPSLNFRLKVPQPIGNDLLGALGRLPGISVNVSGENVPVNHSAHSSLAPSPSVWSSISSDQEYSAVGVGKASAPSSLPGTTGTQRNARGISDVAVARHDSNAGAVENSSTVARTEDFDLHAPVALSKGGDGNPFTISSESQREIVHALAWKSVACIWGGPALALASLYILLTSLGWM